MIKKVLGPPGTGKTYTLLEYVDSYLQKGIPIDKIGYFAFTKKAANTTFILFSCFRIKRRKCNATRTLRRPW